MSLLWKITDFKNAQMPPMYLSPINAWHGHIPFAFFLTEVLKPKTFVELGVHAGDSYIAFCQGLEIAGQPGRAFGVDTFTGDEHSGPYPQDVFENLAKINKDFFAPWSKLLPERFETAVDKFSDGEIDLLHIDGCHTYEAVARDLEMWLPKLSPRGVVLFHDIVVKTGDFGVWRKWAELKPKNRFFEFFHSNGLGVLVPGAAPLELLVEMCHVNSYPEGDWIRAYFELLAERVNAQREESGH